MAELPTPRAARLPRARWLDTRLLLGLLLVLTSVAVGAKLFAEADERVRVWAVTRDLGPQTTLARGDLVTRAVRLDQTAGRYVSADEDIAGLVLTRPVGRHELVPVTALTGARAADQRRVAIEVDRAGAAGLAKGRVVDVYAVPETRSGAEPARAELVLAGATVAEDVRTATGFGAGGGTAGVALYVAGPDVPRLIDAVAHGTVYLVQVPLASAPARRAGPR